MPLNSVISYYTATARKKGIEVKISLPVPQKAGIILDQDLCVLMGNLYANAIEACERISKLPKNMFISIQGGIYNSTLAIQIKNSYEGDLRIENGQYLSSKRKGQGIGLSSVESIVEKYHGTILYNTENNIFTVSIMMNISS